MTELSDCFWLTRLLFVAFFPTIFHLAFAYSEEGGFCSIESHSVRAVSYKDTYFLSHCDISQYRRCKYVKSLTISNLRCSSSRYICGFGDLNVHSIFKEQVNFAHHRCLTLCSSILFKCCLPTARFLIILTMYIK